MGQLRIILELSRLTNLACICVLLSANVIALTEPNCVFYTDQLDDESIPWTIKSGPFSEKTALNSTIWKVPTSNIIGSQSSHHPHTKYLTGHRYPSRYEYRISDYFPNFVDEQNSDVVSRIVIFTCENNLKREVHFQFPLIDENDPPRFLQPPTKEFSVAQDDVGIINENDAIVVFDKDVDSSFNTFSVSTDRPNMLLITSEEIPSVIGKKIEIKLSLNVAGDFQQGRYNLNLFASDGQFTTSLPLKIYVTPPNNSR